MRNSRILGLVLVAGLLVGCARDPNVRKQRYLESGEQYLQQEKYREAAVQFQNAFPSWGRFIVACGLGPQGPKEATTRPCQQIPLSFWGSRADF